MKNHTLMLFVQLDREHPFRWHVKRGSEEEQTCCGEHAIACRSALLAPLGALRESAIDLYDEIDEQTPIELCVACIDALDRFRTDAWAEELECLNMTERAKRLFEEWKTRCPFESRGGPC